MEKLVRKNRISGTRRHEERPHRVGTVELGIADGA